MVWKVLVKKNEGANSESKEESNDLDLFTEMTSLQGSSYYPQFQNFLKHCKELVLKNERPAVQFHFKPANNCDNNTIVLQAELVQAAGVKE